MGHLCREKEGIVNRPAKLLLCWVPSSPWEGNRLFLEPDSSRRSWRRCAILRVGGEELIPIRWAAGLLRGDGDRSSCSMSSWNLLARGTGSACLLWGWRGALGTVRNFNLREFDIVANRRTKYYLIPTLMWTEKRHMWSFPFGVNKKNRGRACRICLPPFLITFTNHPHQNETKL